MSIGRALNSLGPIPSWRKGSVQQRVGRFILAGESELRA